MCFQNSEVISTTTQQEKILTFLKMALPRKKEIILMDI